jgi:hypothetical protein
MSPQSTTPLGASPDTRLARSPSPSAGERFPVRARRRPMVLAAGVALAGLGAMAGAWLVTSVAERHPVLVVVREVPVGGIVQDADLGVAAVSVDAPVAWIPADRRREVVGKVATSTLTRGAVLVPGQVADTVGTPGTGDALAVIVLPASHLPAIGLRAGDPVLVVATDTTKDSPSADVPVRFPGRVVRVGSVDSASMVPIDVLVPDADVATIAAYAADGKVAIALRARTSW